MSCLKGVIFACFNQSGVLPELELLFKACAALLSEDDRNAGLEMPRGTRDADPEELDAPAGAEAVPGCRVDLGREVGAKGLNDDGVLLVSRSPLGVSGNIAAGWLFKHYLCNSKQNSVPTRIRYHVENKGIPVSTD